MLRHETSNRSTAFVKICGVTNKIDALECYACGVDAIGILICKPETRANPGSVRITVSEAARLVESVRGCLHSVVLAHCDTLPELLHLCESIRPSALQIQGNACPADLASLRHAQPQIELIKTFRVSADSSTQSIIADIRKYLDAGSIDGVLLDSAKGGSGEVHDWKISGEIVSNIKEVPCLLAGGLNVLNVVGALEQVRPFGVDAMSSVASEQRQKKDHGKLREFVRSVRAVVNNK